MLLKLKRFGCHYLSEFVGLTPSWYFFFAIINFRGPRDFINRRGLVIQGGDYIYIYIYIYTYTLIMYNAHRIHIIHCSNGRAPGRG